MITRTDLVALHLKGSPTQGAPLERARGERWIRARGEAAWKWELVDVPACVCCGEPAWPNGRCTKHQGRNPCLVEGCTRTRAAPDGRLSTDDVLCGEHWKRYVPPRSRDRRAYLTFFRQAKRYGWAYRGKRGQSLPLGLRFDRFWTMLAKRVRARADGGHLDVDAINRLMGWD